MKKIYTSCTALLIFFINGFSQANNTDHTKTIAAGPEYKRSSFYQWLWGKNYRREWTTPVTFPVTMLDTLKGGVISFKEGGGHQTTSLHLKTAGDKEYALRSVDKSLSKLLPKIFHHTFIEHIGNDEISMSNPYAALGVPIMSQAAGVLYTKPVYVYVPRQPALDSVDKKYSNKLYLFEQRPSGDWSDADNLGNFKKFSGSDEMMEKIYEDNDRQVDQIAFVHDRLFDMLIGDWDRHLDQWKWGTIDSGKQKIFYPVPTDRDQAFSTHNGVLLSIALSAAGINYMPKFDYTIKNVTATERRFLDRLLTNKVTLDQWQTQARSLQQAITDNVIEASIKQMPPEIFAIRGNEIIAKLKSRRSHLVEYATEYYKFLAKEVEIVGSKKDEYFEVNKLNSNETAVNVYKINKEGKKQDDPFYSRTFKADETKEIRLFGLSGNDVFKINGDQNITVRIIGGDKKDSFIIRSSGKKVQIYDDANNVITGSGFKLHTPTDTTFHQFNYDTYVPDKKGIKPIFFYNNEDRFYIGLVYGLVHHKWRKLPFAFKEDIEVHYSISQRAFSALYRGLFPNVIGKWDLFINADYDAIRWTNFYGVGNETVKATNSVKYYRMQTQEVIASIGLQHRFGKSYVSVAPFYHSIKIINNQDRFIAKALAPSNTDIYKQNSYAGAELNYKYFNANDSIVPTKGFSFFGNASYNQNLTQSNQSFEKYGGTAQLYVPLISKFSLAIKAGGATVSGNPMFYELPHIGGADDLRGYKRERFWGKTAFYNSNEIRFITNLRSYILNGKIGLVGFFDEGRVWMPNETSNIWHTDYGVGLLLAPFNKLLANVAYGISPHEGTQVQLRLIKSF